MASAFTLPENEPVEAYAPGSPARVQLKQALGHLASENLEIPLVIDGRPVTTGELRDVRAPHRHALLLGRYHEGGEREVELAMGAARRAWPGWSEAPFEARAAVFSKAAELLATKYRPTLNAATMLGQSKTAYQAEIDAACELIDFSRFNVAFAHRLSEEQPASARGTRNCKSCGRSKGSCWRSRRSTSPPSRAISPRLRPSWGTPWSGSRPRAPCCRRIM